MGGSNWADYVYCSRMPPSLHGELVLWSEAYGLLWLIVGPPPLPHLPHTHPLTHATCDLSKVYLITSNSNYLLVMCLFTES